MSKSVINVKEIKDIPELLRKSKWLEGKTLVEVGEEIKKSDPSSRVLTKGSVGHIIESGFFGIEKNSDAKPDIEHLGVEVKTCPLKYNKSKTKISVKEPLSLNIINYTKEVEFNNLKESSIYRKNKKILFILYLHDLEKKRSEYKILKVFLWEMDNKVLKELEQDYNLIIGKVRQGRAHQIHQNEHKYLTICPKHNGKFKDPACKRSKTKQPFSDEPAEIRAFRLKNKYMNLIINRHFNKKDSEMGWESKNFI
ncbi:MAG: MutH/Sau3AI family endonuclease [archaeon]